MEFMKQGDVFSYAAAEERLFEKLASETGYSRQTTFYSDLSIAEWYGKKSVKETYDAICKSWINDYVYFTEFVICLNYKAWEHSDRCNNVELSELYSELYYNAEDLFFEHYKGDDPKNVEARKYFYETTD